MAGKYRVAYKDGRNQETTADGYTVQSGFFFFTFNGSPVLTVATDLVEHVAEAGAPEPD